MIVISLLAAIIVGIGAGAGMWALDHVGFYLVLLMPLIAGALVGFATYLPVARVRTATAPLVVAALIGGLAALTTYWAASYMDFMNQSVGFVVEQSPQTTDAEARALVEQLLEQEYGSAGFMGFLAASAETGISITRSFGSSGTSLDLQGNVAYGYWILEGLLLIGSAVIVVLRRENTAVYKRFAAERNATPPS